MGWFLGSVVVYAVLLCKDLLRCEQSISWAIAQDFPSLGFCSGFDKVGLGFGDWVSGDGCSEGGFCPLAAPQDSRAA